MLIRISSIVICMFLSCQILGNNKNQEKPLSNAEDNASFLDQVRSHTEFMLMELFPSYMPSRRTVKDVKNIADTSGKFAKVVNAYFGNYAKSLLGEGSSILNPMNYLKFETSAIIYNALSDEKKQWDINSILGSTVQTFSGLKFIFSGTALALNSPLFFTSMSVLGGAHWLYNTPYVKDSIDDRFFGKSLQEDGKIRTEYPWNELFDRSKENIPYLICNFYKSKQDLIEGAKPLSWTFAKRGELEALFPNEYEYIPETSYYQDWFVLKGRWVRINNIKVNSNTVSIMRFATIDNPYSVMEICVNALLKENVIQKPLTQDVFNRIAPQVGYSGSTASYPIFFYTKMRNEANQEVAQLIVQKENSEDEYISPHQQSYTDTNNEFFNHVLNLFGVLITSRRLVYPQNWEYLDTLFKLAKNMNSMRESYEHKESIHEEDIFNSLRNSMGAYTKYFKVKDGMIKDIHLMGSLLYSSSQLNIWQWPNSYVKNWIYGNPLKETNQGFDLEDFHITNLIQDAYMECRFTPQIKKGLTVQVLHQADHAMYKYNKTPSEERDHAQWEDLSLQVPTDFMRRNSFLQEPRDHLVTNTTPTHGVYIDERGEFVKIKGRWIENNHHYVFGTLADPTYLLEVCGNLTNTDLIPLKHRNQKFGSFLVNVTTSFSENTYPLAFYNPVLVKEKDGHVIPKALPVELMRNTTAKN